MPVQEQTTVNQYTANGVTTVFPYQFLLLRSDDVTVEIDGAAQTETSDYTVSGVGVPSGGNITFLVAPLTGQTVVIYRDIPLLRETDYQDSGDFLASVVDADFDRIWMVLQGAKSGSLFKGRPLLLPLAVSQAVSQYVAAPEADTVIGWNSNANQLVNYPLGSGGGGGTAVPYLQIQDEGINVATPATTKFLDFAGAGIEAKQDTGDKVIVTVAGSGTGTGALVMGAKTVIQNDTSYNAFPIVRKLGNGTLGLTYYKGTGHHSDNTGRIIGRIGTVDFSANITWGAEYTVYDHPSLNVVNVGLGVLKSGRIISSVSIMDAPSPPAADPLDGAHVLYSDDNGATWSAPITVNSTLTSFTYMSGSPIQLASGDILVTVEGKNSGDTYSRMRVLRSSDNGITWGTEVEIASGTRNYYEGQLCLLKNGTILCIMRTSVGTGTHYVSSSTDNGATWSAPVSAFAGFGQANTIQLTSGTILAITRGNDSKGIGYTSRDNGVTWGAGVPLGDTSYTEFEYGCPVQLTENRFVVVYAYEGNATNSDIAQVYGTEALASVASSPTCIAVACSDESTALTTGTAKVTFRMPYAFVLQEAKASLSTAQTSGSVLTVDVNEDGVSILSPKLTFDNGEKTTRTAATPAVIQDQYIGNDAEITVDIDQVGDGTAKGLKVYLTGLAV
jgi:hypothetical protein